ncbi:putative acylthioesterase ii [Diaporthe ampelina]|uniref:Putative acylthioesterase ii n=1 Tax=Diaporthe ampelina TaxID=1214573 RepID=A0A0G2FGF3_9PEZI|nr:putative acylthioesterase ii [Diaporthe ampelina]
MSQEEGTNRPTLVRPAPEDPDKAPIENVLDVLELGVFGPDIFTNKRPLWHPPGARGVFGGAMIAMCLAAGQKTVPDDFTVHSCHCYFILAGSSEIPVLFHVERVRDGRSFATRTVQARQKGKCIFTTTMSFTKEAQPNTNASPNHEFKDNVVRHAMPMPTDPATGRPVQSPPPDFDDEPELTRSSGGPFQSYRAEVVNPGAEDPAPPHTKKMRQWYRARGKISDAGGHQAHINALAYMSDSYFIGTVSRIHKLWRFPFAAKDFKDLPDDLKDHIRKLNDFEGYSSSSSQAPDGRQRTLEEFAEFWKDRPEIGMMVSLDHSIYFHAPRRVKADEWMMSEMESPWAGDGRGVVTQRIFAADGTLLATCFQEGVVRLKEPEASTGSKGAAKPKL